MSGEFVQINSIASANADVGCVTLDRVGLIHNDHIKSGISLTKGVSQLGRVVMTRGRPPDNSAIEDKDALLCVAFDGLCLWIKPGSGSHDSSLLFGECRDVMIIIGGDSDARTIVGGYSPSSLFLVGGLVYNIYIEENRKICTHRQIRHLRTVVLLVLQLSSPPNAATF